MLSKHLAGFPCPANYMQALAGHGGNPLVRVEATSEWESAEPEQSWTRIGMLGSGLDSPGSRATRGARGVL